MSFSKLFQGIVDLHDGKISVHSDGEGEGCSFTVEMPMTRFASPFPPLSLSQRYCPRFSPDLTSMKSKSEIRVSQFTSSHIPFSRNSHGLHTENTTLNSGPKNVPHHEVFSPSNSSSLPSPCGGLTSPPSSVVICPCVGIENAVNQNSPQQHTNPHTHSRTRTESMGSNFDMIPLPLPAQTPLSINTVPSVVSFNPDFISPPVYDVLVVDDSLLNRKMLLKCLRTDGHTCSEARDGIEAVNKMKERMQIVKNNSGKDIGNLLKSEKIINEGMENIMPADDIIIVTNTNTSSSTSINNYINSSNNNYISNDNNNNNNSIMNNININNNKSVKHFDAVLIDFMMPNMDGPTATRVMRGLGYTGPIFGVTGNGKYGTHFQRCTCLVLFTRCGR